jgi:hypothetical protein
VFWRDPAVANASYLCRPVAKNSGLAADCDQGIGSDPQMSKGCLKPWVALDVHGSLGDTLSKAMQARADQAWKLGASWA